MKIQRPRRKTLMQVLMIILAIFAMRFYQQQDLTQGQIPSFASKTLSGDIIDTKPREDQAMLVHFWASWCKICELSNPNIQALMPDYKVVNIALQSGSDEEIKAYASEHQLLINNIVNDNHGTLANRFGVNGTPTSFIVAPDGTIRFTEVGYTTTLGYRLRLWWASN